MDAVGATNPQTGAPSLNKLGDLSGVHTTTVSNLINGRTKIPDMVTVEKIAVALKKPTKVVAGWLDLRWKLENTYTPPAEIELLDTRERAIIDEMILALARAKAHGSERPKIPAAKLRQLESRNRKPK